MDLLTGDMHGSLIFLLFFFLYILKAFMEIFVCLFIYINFLLKCAIFNIFDLYGDF